MFDTRFLFDLVTTWKEMGQQLTGITGPQTYYGERSITNNATVIAVPLAADLTLQTNSDYVQVTGIYDSLLLPNANGITLGTNSLQVLKKGVYRLDAWSSLTSSISNNNVSFRFAVNGVITMTRRHWARIGTGGDRVGFAAHGYLPLNANDIVTVWIASDKAANITISDAVFSIMEVIRQSI